MKVFISYSRNDSKLAEQLTQMLRQEGLEVWQDSDILPGQNWALAIGRALEEADALVVLLTPHSNDPPNVTFEIGYALGKEKFAGRVIPVVSSDTSSQNIPWVLGLESFQRIVIPKTGLDKSVAQKIAQSLVPPFEPREKVSH